MFEPIAYIVAIAVPAQARERILQTAIAEPFLKVSHEGQIAPLRARQYITASKDQPVREHIAGRG